VRLEALAAASWLGGESGARVLLIVASCETDKWIRNALNSAMLLLHGEVEALLSKDEFDTDDLSVDHELLLASKLEGAAKPADYRTKSTKFKDKSFARAYQLGERVFYEEGSCYTCHRDHGEGIVRIYPPLVGSEWVTGDSDRLIKLTLHGVWGKIRVRGEIFEPTQGVPPMTAIGNFFSDAEIAGVLTYVRNSWGNDASAVLAKDVKRVRNETKDRRQFYRPEELTEMHPFAEGSRPEMTVDTVNSELEKELQAEPIAELVRAALTQGDPVRGASLFYGKKTACASCHDIRSGFQMGPDLTTSREETTPEFLVESILNPSKLILPGYQSVNVLTVDGQTLSGYLVDETAKEITIRIATEAGKARVIPMDDVDVVAPMRQSTMPAGLANLCGDRQGFLDVAKFVIDINRQGQSRLKELKKQARVK
jgi:putative heme-binding domain-containing protein